MESGCSMLHTKFAMGTKLHFIFDLTPLNRGATPAYLSALNFHYRDDRQLQGICS
jgi:hypothetical protein